MGYLFVVTLVALAIVMIAVKKAAEFIGWTVDRIKEMTAEERRCDVAEETEKAEPL